MNNSPKRKKTPERDLFTEMIKGAFYYNMRNYFLQEINNSCMMGNCSDRKLFKRPDGSLSIV